MNFYFCEACGKRLTEIDIGAGKAKDKKLKGVYCTECSAGVMTMDNLPLTQEQARKILASEPAKTAGARARPATKDVAASVVRPGTKDHSASVVRTAGRPVGAPPKKDGGVNPLVYAGIGVVVLALVGGVALFSGGSRPPVKPIASKPPDPAPVTPVTAPVNPPASPVEPAVRTPPAEAAPAKAVVAPPEDAAAKAFAQLGKAFDGLPAADLAGRVALAEAFLKEHANSLEAARVRVSVDGWKKEIAAQAAPPETKPVEAKPPETNTATKTEPTETKAAELPPIFTQEQRDQLKLLDDVIPLLAKSQLGAALARAQRESRYNLQESLVRVLKRSCDVQERAIESINKKPPSDAVKTSGKLAVTGKIARIKDGKAWINAQGMEMPVELSEIPRDVLLKALDLDYSKAKDLADKLAFDLGAMTDAEATFELWRKQDKVAFHDFVVIAEAHAKLTRLRQFELAVEEIEKTLSSDSVAKIERIAQGYRTISKQNQGRLDALLERAKGMVPSALLKKAFSGEVLKAEDSGYVEVRYSLDKGPGAWKDFELGQGWLFDQYGLRFGCRNNENLTYLPKFKPGKLRVELLVTASANHELMQMHVGFVHLSARWNTPKLHLVYEPAYTHHHQFGDDWALPEIKDRTCRYAIDRTPDKAVFSIDDKMIKELALKPEDVKNETPAKIYVWSWERLMLKEVVIKGFVDLEWLQKKAKETP